MVIGLDILTNHFHNVSFLIVSISPCFYVDLLVVCINETSETKERTGKTKSILLIHCRPKVAVIKIFGLELRLKCSVDKQTRKLTESV